MVVNLNPARPQSPLSSGNTTPVVDSVQPDSIQSRSRKSPFDMGPGYADGGNMFALFLGLAQAADDAPAWSYFPMLRDRYLRQFWKTEPLLAGAIYSMAARGKALEYGFEGGRNQKQYFQTLSERCDMGGGLPGMVFKTLVDLLTQDNGAFWEVIGPGDPDSELVGRITDVAHMDASRCWRTFDPMYPVVYHNPVDFSWHRLHKSRVRVMASMPQPDELARSIGFCPVSRAMYIARTMRAVHRFKYEKLTGTQPAIGYGNGLNSNELRAAVAASKNNAEAEGMAYWNGIPFLLNPDADVKVSLGLISIKGLPDGFDFETDTTLYIYALSLAFGVDAREFWPATASGATKADASIQHMKALGKGIADIIATIETAMNSLLPSGVTFQYDFTDDEQDLTVAQLHNQHITNYTALKAAGVMNTKQVELHLVSKGVLDPTLMEEGALTPDPVAPATPMTLGPDGKPLPAPPMDAPNQATPPQLENAAPSEQLATLSAKAYDDTRRKLVDNLTSIIQGGIDDDLTRRQLASQMRTQLNRLGLQAFNDGLAKGGLQQESLSVEQLKAYRDWQASTSAYVTDFGSALYQKDAAIADAAARAELWANKSLDDIYYQGIYIAAPEKTFTWRLGATEKHCADCLGNAGKSMTMREWMDRGLPKSSDLECGGWRCDCNLEED